ncbi:MAG: beta-propeller domain-containing protein, partial [Myxococcales bacterium]
SDWLPRSYVTVNGQRVEIPADCTQFHRPTGSTRLGLATVSTLDLANIAGGVRQTTVVSEVGEIYSSLENLYIATPHWWWSRTGDHKNHTYLHKFDVTQRDRVSYVGSGVVEGSIVDQFSMDEHNGFLRIATTIHNWSTTSGPNGSVSTTSNTTDNKVFVLAENSGALVVVGQTPSLAPGELIYSSRFSGDRGFVVTYKQVDPLFTLDLADPTHPKVVGELKIPGFSTYIHMLDPTHLLTIGNETTTTSDGREIRTGMSLQIFDVSDMAKPRQADKILIGSQSSWSEALYDHKAFNYFAKTGTLAIPFTDWNSRGSDYWGSFLSAVKLFKVDASTYQLSAAGQIDHSDLYRSHNRYDWGYWYMPWVRRSVLIEDYVFSFSFAGVKVNQVSDLATVKSFNFPLETY